MITVQAHMPFAGKQRKPGDVLTNKEWMTASDTARRALLNQGMVVMSGKSANSGSRVTADLNEGEAEAEGSSDMIELLQGISAKQDRMLGFLAQLLGKPELAAAPPAARKSSKRRKAKKA